MLSTAVFVFVEFIDCVVFYIFFFFKQKTAYEVRISDWSSDVCSSDLPHDRLPPPSRCDRRNGLSPSPQDGNSPSPRPTLPCGSMARAIARWGGGVSPPARKRKFA